MSMYWLHGQSQVDEHVEYGALLSASDWENCHVWKSCMFWHQKVTCLWAGTALCTLCSSVVIHTNILILICRHYHCWLYMRRQSTPQLRDRKRLNCVLLSPVILEELQEHSPYPPPHEMAQQVVYVTHVQDICICILSFHCRIRWWLYCSFRWRPSIQSWWHTCLPHHWYSTWQYLWNFPNENFYSDLAFVSGIRPIIIDPRSAEVIIDDDAEPEC